METTEVTDNNGRSPASSPKSPHRFLRTIRNSPSILRKKIRHSREHIDNPEKDNDLSGDHPECRVFHVLYQGKIRVATLQVHEALAAVKRLTLISSSNTVDVENSADSNVPPKSPGLLRKSPKLSPRLRRKPKPPKKNNLKVTCQYLSIDDPKSSEVEVIPISTIAYCATDIRHPTAVAFINKDRNGGLICHVLLCDSTEKAADIVSFIGQMFESAWEEWKELHPNPVTGGRISPSNLGRSSSFHSTSRTNGNRLTVPGSDDMYRRRPNSFNSTDDYLDIHIDDPMQS
ncbi:uncharacterized protein [Amphiura filiformis]|uniref:uncharacterized protein n=1 Tax=Amphiura filiformis TaxID=82378 RepID=UPI003B21742A